MTSSYFSNPEEVTRKLRDSSVDPDQVREYIFRTSRDAGDLDRTLVELFERGDLGDPDDDYGLEIVEGPELRELATVEDFPDRVPFRGYSFDPDYEDYSAFRLAAENPKISEYLREQNFSLGQPIEEARQALYDAYRSGRTDLQDLNILNTAGQSQFLSDEGYDRESTEAVGDILRNVTGTTEDYEEVMPRVADALELIDEVTRPVTQAATSFELARNTSRIQDATDPYRQELPQRRPTSGPRATQLGLPLTEANPLVERLVGRGELPANFEDFRSGVAELNRIARSGASRGSAEERARANVENQVLPQVSERLSSFSLNNAVDRYIRNRNQELEERNALYNIERNLAPLEQEQSLTRRALERRPSQLVPNFPEDPSGTRPIPGLTRQLSETQNLALEEEVQSDLKKLNEYIEKYPEVGPYLQGATQAGRPVVERDLTKLAKYVDPQQVISKPEDRLKLYRQMGSELGVPVEALRNIETDYTSGDPQRQKKALDYITQLGYGSELESINAPALSTRTPVVGGGGYQPDSDEAQKLKRYIAQRAVDFSNLERNLSSEGAVQLLRATNPGISDAPDLIESFSYDPETQTARIDPEGDYRVRVSRGYSNPGLRIQNPLLEFNNRDLSTNVLRYMADNPVTGTRSISFATATPEDFSLSYDPKDIPRPVFNLMESFIKENALAGARPGTILMNQPLDTSDIARSLEQKGVDPSESSILRREESFIGQTPNRRAAAYRAGGFGPLTSDREQYAFVNAEGKIVPLQPTRPTASLAGKLQLDPAEVRESRTLPQRLAVSQSREPLTSKAYYSLDPAVAAARGLQELGAGIRRVPSALLPGAADLIPSPEAIRTGYAQGPAAMGMQMGQEFVQSLPTAAAAAGVLSTPLAAPLAPGIGAGLVGTAGARALNEIVRQETGEGIVPKLRQFIGTAPRTGATAQPRVGQQPVTAQLKPLTSGQRSELQRQQGRGELQRRLDLAKERFNPRRGEFGVSELLFGR